MTTLMGTSSIPKAFRLSSGVRLICCGLRCWRISNLIRLLPQIVNDGGQNLRHLNDCDLQRQADLRRGQTDGVVPNQQPLHLVHDRLDEHCTGSG